MTINETGQQGGIEGSQFGTGEWFYTRVAKKEAKKHGFYEESDREALNGYYRGRPIIGRDTPINGGVYNGTFEEAIVVDDTNELETPVYNRLYNKLIQRRELASKRGEGFKKGVLGDVFDIASESLPYDAKKVVDINQKHGITMGRKTSLALYIEEGAGVCRHQALLAGYLIERLINEGKLHGQVSVDRSYVKGKGGHAWVRYVTSKDQVGVLDPANGYIGLIENVPNELRDFYERPGLIRKLMDVLTAHLIRI